MMQSRTLITVFTPTYNRRETLTRLYESLLNQTYKEFEWLIVDDGSNDNTIDLIEKLNKENKLIINYISQLNGGKHRAINTGLDNARGEYFFVVDSDDYLPNNSLEIIIDHISKIDNEMIAGVAGRKYYTDNTPVGGVFPHSKFISDHIEKTYINNIKGDLAEVYKTSILKDYKFPDYPNEKFCAEGLIWNRISKKYRTLFFDQPTYYCEYLEDGLSFNSIRNRRNSPNYAMTIYKELAQDKRLPFIIKVRTYINYWRFSFFNDKGFRANWKNVENSILALLIFPLGVAMRLKDDFNDNVKINHK